jgi:hypothetical protein
MRKAQLSDCGFLGQCYVGIAAFISRYTFTSLSFRHACYVTATMLPAFNPAIRAVYWVLAYVSCRYLFLKRHSLFYSSSLYS